MIHALITGCSSGFGRLIALALAERGDTVYATVRSAEAAQALERSADGLQLSTHLLDVTDATAVDRVVSEIAGRGPIDVLINNAGFVTRGPVESLADDELLRQFDTNVFGVVRLVRAVVPPMRDRQRGTIINMSSATGLLGLPFEGAYSASKHAVEGLSEALRFELAGTGITVMLIEPGAYETGLVNNIAESRAFTADHGARPALARFSAFIAANATGAGGRADPKAVVDAALDAVDDPKGPFRRRVGQDAEMAWRVKRESTFEDVEAGIAAILSGDASDGRSTMKSAT
jgi:NAD(P)-dependent dehydrogenase (short-subunit alcohol dehydrogenase family)